jgi:hypothetical protein
MFRQPIKATFTLSLGANPFAAQTDEGKMVVALMAVADATERERKFLRSIFSRFLVVNSMLI